jgi:predicted TIM-barrel fold metal-dependent hydrolase
MSDYFEQVHAGRPLAGVEVIDLHAHLGPYFNMHIPDCDAPAIVKNMDICGIGKAVISTTLSWDTDIVLGNTMMLEAMAAYPGRLYGACAVSGNYPELSLAELERTFANSAVVMVKVHPFSSRCRLDDRRMKGFFDFASKRHLFILVHTWLDNDAYGSQDIFAAVAADYPEAKWIMGHSGGPFGSVRAVEIAQKIDNVFLDITLSMCPAQQIEFFVKEVGSERVLFGTDNPFIDPRPQIGRVALARISEQDRINIFSANARRHIQFP